ncbi:hypothetical protein Scep_030080 [Stephania cephalantha]|uniref:Tubby C-terminal domain-containing protein n=1 Tax=Stephania cephalantha TaxID=152367 RepID=A0AAP0HE13_9MAGN
MGQLGAPTGGIIGRKYELFFGEEGFTLCSSFYIGEDLKLAVDMDSSKADLFMDSAQANVKLNNLLLSVHGSNVFLFSIATLTDDGKFLLFARKCRRTTCTYYIISLDAGDISRGSSTYIGKLSQPPHTGAMVTKNRSTRLVGLKQVAPRVPSGNYSVARISYELNVLGSRGPRRMRCVMDAISAASIEPGGSALTPSEFSISNLDLFPSIPFLRSKSTRMDNFSSDHRVVQKKECFCFSENGPGGPEHEKVILQFGKVGKDLFTMDYRYPISAF